MRIVHLQKVKGLYGSERLLINVPTLWHYWSSFDDYSGEMDVECYLEGELNMNSLEVQMPDGGEDEI